MEDRFKIYNKMSEKSLTTRSPLMSVSKNGLIRLNQAAVNSMGLQPGSEVEFRQTIRDPKEWSILTELMPGMKITGTGYVCRKLGTSGGLGFNAAITGAAIRKSLAITGTLRVPIAAAADTDGSWSLLTSAVKR